MHGRIGRKPEEIGTAICRTCKIERPLTDFYIRESGYHRTDCKVCCISRAKESDLRGKGNIQREMTRRNSVLLRYYGITVEDYKAMYKEQDGRCFFCQKSLPPFRHLHVDHDHSSGRVRALLCKRCNSGIAWVELEAGSDTDRIRQYLNGKIGSEVARKLVYTNNGGRGGSLWPRGGKDKRNRAYPV